MTAKEINATMDLLIQQTREVVNGGRVTCSCGKQVPIHYMYHCYFCGRWVCPKCAKSHFGKKPVGEFISSLKKREVEKGDKECPK
jgi:hypothetical protein